MFGAATNQLRVRQGHEHHRVTYLELFFDLVFVFAVTQLSHGLLKHLTLLGLLQTGMLTLAVWWVWVFTAWATNWSDPDRGPLKIAVSCSRSPMSACSLGGLALCFGRSSAMIP